VGYVRATILTTRHVLSCSLQAELAELKAGRRARAVQTQKAQQLAAEQAKERAKEERHRAFAAEQARAAEERERAAADRAAAEREAEARRARMAERAAALQLQRADDAAAAAAARARAEREAAAAQATANELARSSLAANYQLSANASEFRLSASSSVLPGVATADQRDVPLPRAIVEAGEAMAVYQTCAALCGGGECGFELVETGDGRGVLRISLSGPAGSLSPAEEHLVLDDAATIARDIFESRLSALAPPPPPPAAAAAVAPPPPPLQPAALASPAPPASTPAGKAPPLPEGASLATNEELAGPEDDDGPELTCLVRYVSSSSSSSSSSFGRAWSRVVAVVAVRLLLRARSSVAHSCV